MNSTNDGAPIEARPPTCNHLLRGPPRALGHKAVGTEDGLTLGTS
jgi:hypothetical protein